MNKIFNKKVVAIFSCVLVAIMAFSLAISLPKLAKADFVYDDFEETYFVGDTLQVPTAIAEINGSQLPTKFEIISPNGDVFVNQNHLLTQLITGMECII